MSVVVVTGASAGVGRAAALAFARAGHSVALLVNEWRRAHGAETGLARLGLFGGLRHRSVGPQGRRLRGRHDVIPWSLSGEGTTRVDPQTASSTISCASPLSVTRSQATVTGNRNRRGPAEPGLR